MSITSPGNPEVGGDTSPEAQVKGQADDAIRLGLPRVFERLRRRLAAFAASSWTRDALLLFALSLTALIWFGSKDLLWTPDSNFPVNLQPSVQRYFEVWDFRSMPGSTDTRKLAFVIPWGIILGAWASVPLPYSPIIYQRELLVGLLWGSMISAYILFRVVGTQLRLEPWKKRMGGILAAFLYGFNFFSMLTIWSALSYLMYGYAFLPLVLALVLRGIEKRKSTRYAVGVAIVWTLLLSPAYVTPPVAITDWAAVLLISFVFLGVQRAQMRNILKPLTLLAKILAAWTIFNLYWLIALADLSSGELSKYTGSQGLFVWNAARLSDAFRLAGYPGLTATYKGFPYFAWATWYQNPWVVLAGFLPPVLAVLAMVRRRSPAVVALGVLWFWAIFLVKGNFPPFGTLTDFVFGGSVLGTLYRSTYQRFMGYAALGVSILTPFGALELVSYLAKPSRRLPGPLRLLSSSEHVRAATVCLAVALVSALYVAPVWSGSVYENVGITPSFRVSLPGYWHDLATWLDGQPGDFSVLPFPYPASTAQTILSIDNGTNGLVGLYPLIVLSRTPIAMGVGPGVDLATLLAAGSLRDSRALNILNVRYILVHMDANMPYVQGNNQWVMAPPAQLMQSLNRTSGVAFDRFFGQIAVFENMRWQGSQLLLFRGVDDIEGGYAAFVWNGVSGHVYRWDAPLNATQRPVVDEVFQIPLSPVVTVNSSLSYFAVSRYDPPSPKEVPLPYWVERDPAGTPLILWFRMGLVGDGTRVRLYASDRPLLDPQPDLVFSDFFDSFETDGFARWAAMTGSWSTTTAFAVDGTASAVSGPVLSALDANWSVNSGVLEAWLRFDSNRTAHFPMIAREADGSQGQWAVVLPNGTWGYFNGTAYVPFPQRVTYSAGSWTELRLEFDLRAGRFWVSVDDRRLTPLGLSAIDTTQRLAESLVGFRVQNIGDNGTGRMWVDAIRVRPFAPRIGELPLQNLTDVDLAPRTLSYQFMGSSHTDVHFTLAGVRGEVLVWLKSYSPGWRLTIDGAAVPDESHTAALGYWNGWALPNNGTITGTITYAPQGPLTAVFWFSSASLALAAFFVLINPVPRFRRRLRPRDPD